MREGPFRIGNGIDVHRFDTAASPDARVILGGVAIPFERNLLAHSDGDVLTHALMDAMLGALALGDIGRLFPDTDAKYRGADSLALLGEVNQRVIDKGWQLGNADITVVAQAPKLAPHVEAIRARLAETLAIDMGCISIKATTSEGLGFTGRGEGIAVFATVLVTRKG
jgi:2-C-methyl-D-erythritol 2,4-cyclodiphosphate synthase